MNLFILTSNDWAQIVLYFAALFACVKPLGAYMAQLYSGQRTFISPLLGWLERLLYKISGIDAKQEMDWKQYSFALIGFTFVSFIGIYIILRMQGVLGLNPANMSGVTPDL